MKIKLRHKFRWAILLILLIAYYFCLPKNLFDKPCATVVYDRNGELLGARIADDGQWRFPPRDTVSEKFQICLTRFEDRYFRYHWGVNPMAVGRALLQNIREKRTVSGGSTITMQVIRLSRNKKRTISEKVIEAVLATRLEFRYSKRKILAIYASNAPFGGNVVGLEAASERYFGHSSDRLSWAEAATLAVLPNSPALLHLSRNRPALKEKRDRLLHKLLDDKVLSQTDYELAIDEPLPGEPLPLPQTAPYLVSLFYGEKRGQQIISTIDRNLQTRIETLLERRSVDFRQSGIRNAAAIVIDVKNNQTLAYCGNVRFSDKDAGNQVDVVQADRSTGSILKPFLYCAMLQEGEILPNTLLPDIPLNINGFSPQNFNLQYEGAVPASEAVSHSLNVPLVYMLRKYSVPKFYNFLKQNHIARLPKPASHYGLSLILGGAEARLGDVANAYSNMARTLQGLENAHFSLIKGENPKQEKNTFSQAAVMQVFEVLTEVNRPEQIDWKSIPSMQKIAWKTGTSYGFRDAWAVGATPRYVVGVWVGNASGEGRPNLTGARTAGPVMFDIFEMLPSSGWFKMPEKEMVEAEVCRLSGHLKSRFCGEIDTVLIHQAGLKTAPCPYHISVNLTADGRYRVYESCAGSEPVIRENRFVLPPAWAWFYRRNHPDYQPLPPFKAGCGDAAEHPMQFIYPQGNTVVHLPKQLDGSDGEITFELAHNSPQATVFWHIDNEYVATTSDFHKLTLPLALGRHSVTAVDDAGNSLSISVEVR
ncbi:MAG: penicillin-binding protein 1C [Dysgonamonadaceae bacterium]|nr:penicillin-binding protein 1C [Dysgonamonadaceae bacterium]